MLARADHQNHAVAQAIEVSINLNQIWQKSLCTLNVRVDESCNWLAVTIKETQQRSLEPSGNPAVLGILP